MNVADPDADPSGIPTLPPRGVSTPPGDGRSTKHAGAWLRRHWGSGLALLFAALVWGADVATLRELLILLALVYAVMAAVDRPRTTWPVFIASFALFLGATTQQWVRPDALLIGIAAAALLAGTAFGRDPRALAVQGVGVLIFGVVAVLAAGVAHDGALWLVAGGWAAHGLWDLAHLRARRVVHESYAEYCAVLDLCVAVMLVVNGT